MTNTLKLKVIAWVSDASGETRAARIMMMNEHPHLIILDCWAHQIQLVLGDYIKANNSVAATIKDANSVVKWFCNHSWALGQFNAEQRASNNGTLAFIKAVITRWTAHYCSVSRLLELQPILRSLVIKKEAELIKSVGTVASLRESAKIIMRKIKDQTLWDNLEL